MSSSRASAGAPLDGNARQRILRAATDLACSDGYGKLTAERVLSAAGASRASFYQYFSDIDDCFAGAYRHHADQLVSDVASAVSDSNERELATFGVLLDTAIAHPEAARLLMGEGHAAGIVGLRERGALISRLAQTVSGDADMPSRVDIPTPILLGGVFRFLSMRMAQARVEDELRADLGQWATAFTITKSQKRWSRHFNPTPRSPSRMRRSLGRPADPQRSQSPCERIIDATAVSICEKGYRNLTVADIVATAGLSRRCFYNEFANKSAAAIAAYEHGFARALAACAPAYFSTDIWPERIWESAEAFTGFLTREPRFAYFGFVEGYAISREFTSRVHDTQLAFTLFLEEGYRQNPKTHALSRECLGLIVASVAELGLLASLGTPGLDVRRMQPMAVYLTLAPFIGSQSAGSFVAGKLGSNSEAPAAA